MQTCCYEMLLDILYPDWIQNQKSYIENMLFIILTYHEINRNSIFALETVLYRTIYHAFLPQNRSRIFFIKKEAVMNALSDTLTTSWLFHQLYSRKIGESASRYGVSKTEADILLFLCNNPGFDTARDIVNIRGIAKSYVSKSIEILVQKQYLTTSVDRRDRRITHLRLTEEANAALTDLRKTQEEIFALITQKIPEERKKRGEPGFSPDN